METIQLEKYKAVLQEEYVKKLGRVSRVIGLTIESIGPDVSVGDYCIIKEAKKQNSVLAEVVGFRDSNILLMPFGSMEGISQGGVVSACSKLFSIKISESLLGRVINGLGEPIDGKGNIQDGKDYLTKNSPPNPLTRTRIKEPLTIGVKAIDGLLTIGKGQRVGVFSGSGVGKSTLLGMIARNTEADVNVIALIGERGREVREFIEKDLGDEGLKRSILVVATSDQPALVRLKAAEVATSIAEYFREEGKDCLLLMDSLTRYAMAQREIGLAIGEPPVSRGFTPSVFSIMPKLLERAGTSEKGSITAIYTVLVDGDDFNEPVTDMARGILDGHIVLSRKIANKNHYPAIDVLSSVSRVMTDIVSTEHKNYSEEIKKNMSVYREANDLINIGVYVAGSNSEIDESISKKISIDDFLKQTKEEKFDFPQTIEMMKDILAIEI